MRKLSGKQEHLRKRPKESRELTIEEVRRVVSTKKIIYAIGASLCLRDAIEKAVCARLDKNLSVETCNEVPETDCVCVRASVPSRYTNPGKIRLQFFFS